MGAGLQKQLIPLFVGGGIDTKTDPRLAGVSANAAGASTPNGALLELENLYMQRTGELRWRNGFSSSQLSTVIGSTQTIISVFKGPPGQIGVLIRNVFGSITPAFRVMFYSIPVTTLNQAVSSLIISPSSNRFPFPGFTVFDQQLSAFSYSSSQSISAPDVAIASGWIMTAWRNQGSVAVEFSIMDINGTPPFGSVSGSQQLGFTPLTGAYPRCVAGGTQYLVAISQEITTLTTKAAVVDVVNSTVTKNLTVATFTNAGLTNGPMAVTSKPGSNNIIFAARAASGGVSVCEWNPSTGTAVTTTNIAGADAAGGGFIGFLDNQSGDGNYYLITGGSTSGVVCRTISSAIAVTATLTIDAASTTNFSNCTGFVNSAGGNYVVAWDDIIGTTQGLIKTQAVASGAVSGPQLGIFSFNLLGKAFRMPGYSEYYFPLAFKSSTQPSSFICQVTSSGGIFVSSQFQYGNSWGYAQTEMIASVVPLGSDVISALVRQTRIVTVAGYSYSAGIPVLARIKAPSAPFSPCEIGGSYFLPGSPLSQVSSPTLVDWSEFQVSPEMLTATPTAGGSLTALGTYQYCVVFTALRADGSQIRSAPSVPISVTLTGANQAVSLTWLSFGGMDLNTQNKVTFWELYRAGPAAAGSTTFNKISSSANSNGSSSGTFNDNLSDANAASGEILYTTGGVLDNLPPPACNLMTANNGRAFVVNSENPTELWFSKQRKVGEGVYFHPLLRLNITGDGYGAITALSAMDGRVIAFKSNAIYVISGDGPDDTGGGSFNPPQAITLNIGTTNPASVVTVPDGIMFEAAAGIYLLDRGLSLTYLGAPVEQYTNAENVVGASIADGFTQVRFVMPSGRCLVWDYHHKRWYTWKLRVDTSGVASTVVGCAQIQGGVWCYALADGSIFQETPGVFSDVNGTTTAIVPRVGFPQVNTGGINGFQRVYCMQIEGEYVGDHTLQVSAVYDLGAATETTRALAITSGPYQYEVFFSNPKCSTIQINLTASLAAGSGGFRLSAASLLVGVKRGSQFASSKRLT